MLMRHGTARHAQAARTRQRSAGGHLPDLTRFMNTGMQRHSMDYDGPTYYSLVCGAPVQYGGHMYAAWRRLLRSRVKHAAPPPQAGGARSLQAEPEPTHSRQQRAVRGRGTR